VTVGDRYRLDGRLALITGGGRGLGAAAAAALAQAGASVVIVGRTEGPLAETAEGIVSAGGEAAYRVCDVSDEQQVTALFDELAVAHGPVDVLLNNAAVVHEEAFAEVAAADWDRVFDINVRGAFFTCRSLARQASDRPRSIINVSSVAASSGVRFEAAYSASKAAIEGLTRALAIELARASIRVNAVSPGYFRTDMPGEVLADERALASLMRRVPQRRVADPEEIGATIVYLASDASRFMTGEIIHLDGGYAAQ
jgi:NAD(P)-dependent dehydrogenase (short-subunit alcohol dehydrogenase family)